jgi:hypothetical protein
MSGELAGELEYGMGSDVPNRNVASDDTPRDNQLDDQFLSVDWDDISETPRWKTYAWMVAGMGLIIGSVFIGMVIMTNLEPEPPGTRLEAPSMVQ